MKTSIPYRVNIVGYSQNKNVSKTFKIYNYVEFGDSSKPCYHLVNSVHE